MKIGVKTGPENWREPFERTNARYCEVWFRVDWKDRFQNIFRYLRKNKIEFGLHFWAILPAGFEPNLAYEKDGIADQSQEQVRKCIDIAQKVGAYYVNVHPGSLILRSADLERKELKVLHGNEISLEKARSSLLQHTRQLHQYAQDKGVLFMVETLPKNELEHWRDLSGRKNIQEAKNIPPEVIIEIAESGVSVCNDFGHTAASWVTDDPDVLFKNVYSVTKRLAPQTRLIHLNTVIPPFNGTDSHNGVLEKDFRAGVFPNRGQLKKLLQPFKERDDVWVIPEPETPDMAANYFAIKELIENL